MNAKSSNAEGGWGATAERTSRTDDQRIEAVTPLPPPEHLIRFFPIAGTPVERLIGQTRDKVRRIMQRKDDRLLVIMGPCSIHEPAAALEYARKLLEQRHRHADTLEIVMRVYFEKPRITVGWKGAFTVRIRPSLTNDRLPAPRTDERRGTSGRSRRCARMAQAGEISQARQREASL